MKFNFWQWIGLVLLIVGIAMWIGRQFKPNQAPSAPASQAG